MKSRRVKTLISVTCNVPSGPALQNQDSSTEATSVLFKSFLKKLSTPSTPSTLILDPLTEKYEAFPSKLKAKLSLENGRLFFTVQGAGIRANLWDARLASAGHKLSKCAVEILSKQEYDECHRLQVGKTYKLGLVLGGEIPVGNHRSTKALEEIGFGQIVGQVPEKPKAEIALLVREKFSNNELKIMGLSYIAVLHAPVVDSKGLPKILISEHSVASLVGAHCAGPENLWLAKGAYAFPAKVLNHGL